MTVKTCKNLIYNLFTLVLCSLSSNIFAQNFTCIAEIDTVANLAALDNFGNLFLVTPKNEVMKFNPKGKFLWNYTNNAYGDINQIDVSDPLRVILYYPAYQQIVVLNNNLSEISKFNFNSNPSQLITLVASANNNGFWVYDGINREIKKLSNNFAEDLNTGNIYQRNGLNPQANFMLNSNEYLFINDMGKGVLVFDRFGNFFKTAVINCQKHFNVIGSEIFYVKNKQLHRYNFLTFENKTLEIPIQQNFTDIILHNQQLIMLTEKGVSLWAY
ncbi:MAG: hypothetical protein EAZ51_01385 [Sphingobacteriales bacterium]|nr:MAG: hypothetical protein EAZ51_01385 [Sphingobacteriales bacterium]